MRSARQAGRRSDGTRQNPGLGDRVLRPARLPVGHGARDRRRCRRFTGPGAAPLRLQGRPARGLRQLRQRCIDELAGHASTHLGPQDLLDLMSRTPQLAPLVPYLIQTMTEGGDFAQQLWDRLVHDTEAYLAAAVAGGKVRPTGDERRQGRVADHLQGRHVHCWPATSCSARPATTPRGQHPADIDIAAIAKHFHRPALELFTHGMFTTSDTSTPSSSSASLGRRSGFGHHATREATSPSTRTWSRRPTRATRPAAERHSTMTTAIEVNDVVKTFGPIRALDRLDLSVDHRRGARLSRPERGREVDHHPGPARPAAHRFRHRPGARRRPVAGRGATCTAGWPTCPAMSTCGPTCPAAR